MGRVSRDIDDIYFILCRDLLHSKKVGNTRELTNVKIQLTNIGNNVVSIRDISPSYLIGELLWYFTGRNDMKFISRFSKFWEKISDDGVTSNSAYGYIMKKKHGFDQIEKIIELLQKDPDSRRAVINLNEANERVIETKDEPCTIAVQFLLRNGKLDCTTMMRSNDIWFGFPYDVAFFTELQKYVADRLGVGYGFYTHFVTSMHLYDRDAEKVRAIVDDPTIKPVTFDRKAFHDHCENMAELVAGYNNDLIPFRRYFMDLLDAYGIYKEVKVEN